MLIPQERHRWLAQKDVDALARFSSSKLFIGMAHIVNVLCVYLR
jgi:hypothetical protein